MSIWPAALFAIIVLLFGGGAKSEPQPAQVAEPPTGTQAGPRLVERRL